MHLEADQDTHKLFVLLCCIYSCSQQIQFGLQNPQEIINCGVFHVYERSLYKMPERIPHPNGVLDQRLVSGICVSRWGLSLQC